jgi:hypothetical protein
MTVVTNVSDLSPAMEAALLGAHPEGTGWFRLSGDVLTVTLRALVERGLADDDCKLTDAGRRAREALLNGAERYAVEPARTDTDLDQVLEFTAVGAQRTYERALESLTSKLGAGAVAWSLGWYAEQAVQAEWIAAFWDRLLRVRRDGATAAEVAAQGEQDVMRELTMSSRASADPYSRANAEVTRRAASAVLETVRALLSWGE